jgi:transketolase
MVIDNKYITIENADKTSTIKSPTYGEYVVRKIATVDYILALKNKELEIALDAYDKLKSNLGCTKTIIIDSVKVTEYQSLSKFEVYTAFIEDNKDWVDPRGLCKKLPVAQSINKFKKMFNKK